MAFTFLDKIAGIVGEPVALAEATRARVFREPLRHDGLRRLPHPEVLAHVGRVAVGIANDRLREPLEATVSEHAEAATLEHEMLGGEPDELRDAVIAAFVGNDCGLDLAAFGPGEATPAAAALQVLVVPEDDVVLSAVLARLGLTDEHLRPIADDVLAPAAIEPLLRTLTKKGEEPWSLNALAETLRPFAAITSALPEALGYLFSADAKLWATAEELLDVAIVPDLCAWLDERAMFSSPEQDDADVAEVLRLVNQEGGGSHIGNDGVTEAANITAAGVEPNKPAPAAPPPRPAQPVASPESDVTRAVAAALRALFELTKETDTHVAEVLGVPKAVVAQARKDVTPWEPDTFQFERLLALVVKYANGLLAVRDGMLDQRRDD